MLWVFIINVVNPDELDQADLGWGESNLLHFEQ